MTTGVSGVPCADNAASIFCRPVMAKSSTEESLAPSFQIFSRASDAMPGPPCNGVLIRTVGLEVVAAAGNVLPLPPANKTDP